MTIKDKLDIFIITYNRAESLKDTFDEIFTQNSPIKNFSIKILDNNSSDDTYNIVSQYQKRFPNLKYYKNKYNIGGNANIVKAFYMAEKEYVWILADNDHYFWNSWNEVEDAINNKEDAIMVSNYAWPNLDVMHLLNQATFTPGVIYKVSNIDDTVMGNMIFNAPNMFPHAMLFIKLLNKHIHIPIVSKGIVVVGNNIDKKTGKHIYTRGFDENDIHPLQASMTWDSGFANTIYMIKDKKVRDFVVRTRFNGPPLNSVGTILRNKHSIYNIMIIFSSLNLKEKLLYLLKIFYAYTFYYLIYFYKEYSRYGEKLDKYSYRWCINIFGGKIRIRTKNKEINYQKIKNMQKRGNIEYENS